MRSGHTPLEPDSPAGGAPAPFLGAADVRAIAARALAEAQGGRASERLRRELEAVDRSSSFTRNALVLFQDLLARLGVATSRPILVPRNQRPFWLRGPHPLANYQTSAQLPAAADVVVIGAGLTGAATAYHLRNAGLRILVLDQGDPAGEASGRNGGNFQLIPENSVGIYEGLARERFSFMRRRYPEVPKEVLQAVSERQASLVLGMALRNRDALKETILNEGISCDFSPRGWLYLAANEVDEQGLCDEVLLAARHGQPVEIWSPRKIREQFGFDGTFLGRFIPGDGTYHPFRYVCGLLESALRTGVELYTRVKVRRIVSSSTGDHCLLTSRGTIAAQRVIVATNAFTRELLPELSAIEPYQSQIVLTEDVADCTRGRVVTSDNGPVFFNQPREGARDGRAPLLMGGGADRPLKDPSSRRCSPLIHSRLLALRDHFYPELVGQPPSAEWIGPLAVTPDGLPCIGFLRPGLVVVAGCNGYGGSYMVAAGSAAADMVLSDVVPEWVPDDVFSPRRLLHDEPLFLTERDGLWRVAVTLTCQLLAVDRKVSEALTLSGTVPAPLPRSIAPIAGPPGASSPAGTVAPERLRSFASFSAFSHQEIRRLLRLMRRWDLPKGTIIFTEGSAGGTCFVVVNGTIDVSVNARGRQQLLATLSAGSVLGQVSLISGAPRSATCSVRSDAVLLEIERESCERLLRGESALAVKFLATLNAGLISALRAADQRLMKLDREALRVEHSP
jgi:glycine/D-amino acid oxidase-like deaminating enzyme